MRGNGRQEGKGRKEAKVIERRKGKKRKGRGDRVKQ